MQVNFKLCNQGFFEKVSDKDGAVMARRLAREEGIMLGYSCGSAVAGLMQLKDKLTKDDVVVVIFHDHGSRYVGKLYNDEWMRERGFLDGELTVNDLVTMKEDKTFYSVAKTDTIRTAFQMMKDMDLSQVPVMDDEKVVGSLTESAVLTALLENPMHNTEKAVETIMGKPFPMVEGDLPFSKLGRFVDKKFSAVLTKDNTGRYHVLTQYDIMRAV